MHLFVKPRTGSLFLSSCCDGEASLSHGGGYFHSGALVFQLLCGCPLCNWIGVGLTFLSKSSRVVVLCLCALSQRALQRLSDKHLLGWMSSAVFSSEGGIKRANAPFPHRFFSFCRYPATIWWENRKMTPWNSLYWNRVALGHDVIGSTRRRCFDMHFYQHINRN